MAGLATADARPNLHYDLINPETGINYGRPTKGWRYDRNTMARLISENRIIWPESPEGRPRKKQFLADLEEEFTGYSSIIGDNYYTRDGNREQMEIWGEIVFDFPKNSGIIQELIEQATDKDSIVLDSFAGSGTTAHAVLNMNKADGGNRRFILVEMGDYADTITAERVKRVIDGYGEGKSKTDGTGGGFSFYELGEKLLIDNEYLNPLVDDEIIREYIWYMETRSSYKCPVEVDNRYYLGTHNDTAYYFDYEKDSQTVLDNDFLKTIKTKADAYVIYADTCNLSETKMGRYNITFKKIPRDIARL